MIKIKTTLVKYAGILKDSTEDVILIRQRIRLPKDGRMIMWEHPHKFSYEFDNSYEIIAGQHNTIITDLETQVHYMVTLNFFQRLKLSWMFGNCWVQKQDSVMWLVNIMIGAILATDIMKRFIEWIL